MRIRIPELFDERGVNAYQLAKRSGGRISLSTAYRWKRLRGRVKTFDADALDAALQVFGCGVEQLLEPDEGRPARKRRGSP